MLVVFVIIAAILGFIPGASFILTPMEVYLVYSISKKYNAFNFFQFVVIAGAIVASSIFLKGLASFLHFIPVFGQIANSIVAGGFMFILGSLAEEYYSKNPVRD